MAAGRSGWCAPETPDRPGRGRRWLLVAFGLAAFWIAVGLLVGIQVSIFDAVSGNGALFGRVFRAHLVAALVWIPATPIPWLLAARFPIGRATWMRNVPLHLALSVTFAAIVHFAILLLQRSLGLHPELGTELFRLGVASLGRQIHLLVLVYWIIVGARLAWLLHQETRARELEAVRLEAELNRATLEALRLQLRPHFLFNALHTIGLLWRTGRAEEAQETLERLSALLRGILDERVPREVPLSRELALARHYLAVEEVRFGDRLSVEVCAGGETRDALVPPLLLQPLLENAITHGIEPSSRPGHVWIITELAGAELVVEVQDDGLGPADRASTAGMGIGLTNTRRRLETLYGSAARLEVTARPEGGTSVRVVLPYRPAELADTEAEHEVAAR
jgi:signal transduction histidine kinase